MRFLMLIAAFVLSACTATQGLSVLSYSNADVESVLKQQLPKLTDKSRLMGIPVELGVDNIQVNIGPDKRDVVMLGVDASAGISALVFDYTARLSLKVEGTPQYDSKEKAIFLRDIKLLDSTIDAGGYKGNLGVLDNNVMGILNAYLASNPVYRLDQTNSRVAMISKLPLDLVISEGALRVVPKL
jgi:hypothetical protein